LEATARSWASSGLAIAATAGLVLAIALLLPPARGIALDATAAALATVAAGAPAPRMRSVSPALLLDAMLAGLFAAGLDWELAQTLGVVYAPATALGRGPFAPGLFALAFGALALSGRRTRGAPSAPR
jgi:hypothetical protein